MSAAAPLVVTDQTIQQAEAKRGAQAWTGEQGAADAFALMGQHWNVDIYATLSSMYSSGYQLEKLG